MFRFCRLNLNKSIGDIESCFVGQYIYRIQNVCAFVCFEVRVRAVGYRLYTNITYIHIHTNKQTTTAAAYYLSLGMKDGKAG